MSDAGIILVVDQINKTVNRLLVGLKHKEITAFLLAAGYQQEVVFHISSTAFFFPVKIKRLTQNL